jgi:hypothetical protein
MKPVEAIFSSFQINQRQLDPFHQSRLNSIYVSIFQTIADGYHAKLKTYLRDEIIPDRV